MAAKPISFRKINFLHESFIAGETNIRLMSRTLKVARCTIRRYLTALSDFKCQFPKEINNINYFLSFIKTAKDIPERKTFLNSIFQSVHDSIVKTNSTRKAEWEKYIKMVPNGYRYTQFAGYFSIWLKENKIVLETNNSGIKLISSKDLNILNRWRRSKDKRKWDKAVVILEAVKNKPISKIALKVERSRRGISKWLKNYAKSGLDGIQNKKRKINIEQQEIIETKKSNLMKLIHETPKNYGINRASWSLETLSNAYYQKYGISVSTTSISDYIKSLGYVFRKAKKVLTSPDPKYREKLQNITKILSNLTDKQKFFSVDEFGPFAVKIQGGKSIVKKGETKTYPQFQKSKGCLICTAGLELSQNQITHFYSFRKNTDEMIKLLELLLVEYKNEEKIFFSWDAASWHSSKKLKIKIDEINNEAYRSIHQTPLVELAPLPASAQFLNVVESVFSGMSKGIIHNSDYQSIEECKSAIDQYFKDRNDYFKKNPKRAGKKIWGKENNKPVFDETKNFKDSRWR